MSERVGSFELERRLGAGELIETFVAIRRGYGGIDQRVCLQRIVPARQHDPESVRAFLEAGRIAGRLRHATIVQVIDAGEHDGVPYLALELIEGESLRALIDAGRARDRRLPPECVTRIALDLATALEVAHRDHLAHGGVSPAKVLVSFAGEVKLAGFGAPASTGVAGDLHALGITLFEAASSALPSPRASVVALAPGLDPALAAAIDRLVHLEPSARFASAELLFDALAALTPLPSARRALGAMAREWSAPRSA